jgi:hypothetical protein
MRVSSYALAMLMVVTHLGSTSVFGQQIAAAAAGSDCPTEAPDSLQISWTQPCSEGDWLLDPEVGCRMADWHPDPKDRALWSGTCPGGDKQGQGVVQWTEHGQAIDRFEGTYRNGKREGFGRYVWTPAASYEGLYADDVPNGLGTATLLGESFSGTWKNGCLASRGRIVAIGVERSSCGAPARAGQTASF